MTFLLEWGGAVLVLVGYGFFGRRRVTAGAVATLLAALSLVAWAAMQGAYGVLALNVVVACMQVWTIWKERLQ